MSGTRVYVGGLSYRARERDLEKFFRKYGHIREISMKNGFCFVDFEDYRDADDACYELNGKDFMGDRVTVEIARGTPHGRDRDRWGGGGRGGGRDRRGGSPRRDRPVWMDKYGPPTRTDYKLIVENLSSRVSWQDLKDYMRQAGEVSYADAHRSRKNEGVVEFGSRSEMKRAIEKLDGTELNGRKIKLVDCYKKRSYSRSQSRSRSPKRSRSHSRSRSRSVDRRKARSHTRSRSRDANKDSGDKDRSRSRSGSRGRRSDDDSDERASKSNGKRHDNESNDKCSANDNSRSHEEDDDDRGRGRGRSRSRSGSHNDD